MARSIISAVLESFLGKYVDGLNDLSLINVGLWNGEVELKQLSLKKEMFNELDLPIKVLTGQVEKVHVVVPWDKLGSASVQITIEGINLVVVPRTDMPSDEEILRAKLSNLETAEIFRKHYKIGTGNDDSTFFGRLTAKIVDNLQLTLKRIHVRYEDTVTQRQVPFAMGICLRTFTFRTTNANGRDTFLDRTQAQAFEYIHKKAQVMGLCIYWNRLHAGSTMCKDLKLHHCIQFMNQIFLQGTIEDISKNSYILKPTSLNLYVVKNESLDYRKHPKYAFKADINDIGFELSRYQYDDIFVLMEAAQKQMAVEKYVLQARRPCKSVSDNPLDWWDHAIKHLVPRKRRRFRWSSIYQARCDHKQYMKLYEETLRASSSERKDLFLRKFEECYPNELIIILRSKVEDVMNTAKAKNQESSWYNYLFGSSSSQDVLSDEGKNNLRNAMELEKKIDEFLVPEECVVYSIDLNLGRGSLSLLPYEANEPSFCDIVMQGSIQFNMFPSAWNFTLSCYEYFMKNGLASENNRFKYHCVRSNDSVPSDGSDELCTHRDSNSTSDVPCVYFHMSSSGASSSEYVLSVSVLPFKILLDATTWQPMYEFFYTVKAIDLMTAAGESLQGWASSNEKEIEIILNARKSWHVSLDLSAPVFIIPEDIHDANTAVCIVDLGHCQVSNSIKAKKESNHTEVLTNVLQVEVWHFEMQRLQVHLCPYRAIDESSYSFNELFLRSIVREFSLNVQVESLREMNGDRTSVLLRANLAALAVRIAESDVEALGRVQSSLFAGLKRMISSAVQAQPSDQDSSETSEALRKPSLSEETICCGDLSDAWKPFTCVIDVEKVSISVTSVHGGPIDLLQLQLFDTSLTFSSMPQWSIFNLTLRRFDMEDHFHDPSSPYFFLITSQAPNISRLVESDRMIAVKITHYSDSVRDRPASYSMECEFNELHVQWNPSTVMVVYRIIHAFQEALLYYQTTGESIEIFDLQPLKFFSSPLKPQQMINCDLKDGAMFSPSLIPPIWKMSASMKRLVVCFNKNEVNRRLCRCEVSATLVEWMVSSSTNLHKGSVSLGTLAIEDTSTLESQYQHILGSCKKTVEDETSTRSPKDSALTFEMETYDSTHETPFPGCESRLAFRLRSVEFVYLHQFLLEMVDYLFEGVLGVILHQTVMTATTAMLDTEAISLFEVAIEDPRVVIPIHATHKQALTIRARRLHLEHTPRIQKPRGKGILMMDSKIFFVQDLHLEDEQNAKNLLCEPINLRIEIDDIFRTTICTSSTSSEENNLFGKSEMDDYEPRFFIDFIMSNADIILSKDHYLLIVGIILFNFGDLSVEASRDASTSTRGYSNSSRLAITSGQPIRPVVDYGYDLSKDERVTISFRFQLDCLICDFVETNAISIGKITAKNFSCTLSHLIGRDPNIKVLLDKITLQDKICNNEAEKVVVIMDCFPMEICYEWKEDIRDGETRLTAAVSNVTSIIVPHSIYSIVQFFQVEVQERFERLARQRSSHMNELARRAAIQGTGSVLDFQSQRNSDGDHVGQFKFVSHITASNVQLHFPKAFDDFDSKTICIRANFALKNEFEPNTTMSTNRINLEACDIEVYLRHVQRANCSGAIQILEPSMASIELILVDTPEATSQIVKMELSPIDVYLSYLDIQFLRKVVERFQQDLDFSVVSISSDSAGTVGPDDEMDELFPANRISSSVESSLSLQCNFQLVRLTIINDCQGCDMGLLQLRMSDSNFFLKGKNQNEYSGSGHFRYNACYYNPDDREWESMCDAWTLDLIVYYNRMKAGFALNFSAQHLLNIHVTHGLLEALASAVSTWSSSKRDKQLVEKQMNSDQLKEPFLLRNQTGIPFHFWMNNDSVDRKICDTGDTIAITFLHLISRGKGVTRKYTAKEKPRLLSISIHGYKTITNISFDELGANSYPILRMDGGISNLSLLCHSLLEDGRIILSISSRVKISNKCSIAFDLLVHDSRWEHPVEIGSVSAGEDTFIPLLHVHASELRIHPKQTQKNYGWSSPIPLTMKTKGVRYSLINAQVKSGTSSSSSATSASFCVTTKSFQSLEIVSLHHSITVVNKLPVVAQYKLRKQYQEGETVHANVNAGETSYVMSMDCNHIPVFSFQVQGCYESKVITLEKVKKSYLVRVKRADGGSFRIVVEVDVHMDYCLRVCLFAQYWMVNQTGLPLIYTNDGSQETNPSWDGRGSSSSIKQASITLFSLGDTAQRMRLRTSTSSWSTPFEPNPQRLSWQDECIVLKPLPSNTKIPSSSNSSNYRRRSSSSSSSSSSGSGSSRSKDLTMYELGISADYSTHHFGNYTTVVSIVPRYLLVNRCNVEVIVREGNVGHARHVVQPGATAPLYWHGGRRCPLSLTLGEEGVMWSSSDFSTAEMGSRQIACEAKNNIIRFIEVDVKQGGPNEATYTISFSEDSSGGSVLGGRSSFASNESSFVAAPSKVTTTLRFDFQFAGMQFQVVDFKGRTDAIEVKYLRNRQPENVARLRLSDLRILYVAHPDSIEVNGDIGNITLEDLLANSQFPLVLSPVKAQGAKTNFCSVSYFEKKHPKFRWIDRASVQIENLRLQTSMRFVQRLNVLSIETLSSVNNNLTGITQEQNMDAFLLEFVPSSSSSKNISSNKVYINVLQIHPILLRLSFTRNKDDKELLDGSAGFWLKNLKLKIENASLSLEAYSLKKALATTESVTESIVDWYSQSVKSQAMNLIESIEITSLVTDLVTGGVSSMFHSLMGKADPKLMVQSQFQKETLSNVRIMEKHAHNLLHACHSHERFLEILRHLIFDWDFNHTGLEARGCIALAVLNTSKEPVLITPMLNDGAEIRVLPSHTSFLAGTQSNDTKLSSSTSSWQVNRAAIIFAWGFTPTFLTTGDIYFQVHSNAFNVFATRTYAQVKANRGYCATFIDQEIQTWWSRHVLVVGDEISEGMFSPKPSHEPMDDAKGTENAMSQQEDEFEVLFMTQSLGVIVHEVEGQVFVRKHASHSSQSEKNGAALFASGKIQTGDQMISVNGIPVSSIAQFQTVAAKVNRPLVVRFRRARAPVAVPAGGSNDFNSEAYRLFG